MLPLQIIVVLGILFLLVLCCMIAAQLTTGPMPITGDEVVTSPEAAWPISQDTRPFDCAQGKLCAGEGDSRRNDLSHASNLR